MKFSALNVDFNSPGFDPLGSRSFPYTDLLRIITSTADELFGGTNDAHLE